MVLRGILATLAFYVVAAVVMFAAAGRWNLPAFWAWLAVMVLSSVTILPILERTSPGLLAERLKPGPGDRDRRGPFGGVMVLFLMLAIAGYDAGRFHWSAPMPTAVVAIAWAALIAGFWLVAWAMIVNRFFSSAVRIQGERGQQVVRRGPYAIVRHPGYLAGLLYLAAIGPTLGSWWAMLPAALAFVGIVRRTRLEDAMLRRELPGYEDYAGAVRWRLLPGVW